MNIVERELSELKRYENNPRINSHAVDAVAASIEKFGYSVPIVIDSNNVIVCGDTRYQACEKLGLKKIQCVLLTDLSEEKIRAFRILDNKIAEKADWDFAKLELELSQLEDFDFSSFDVDFGDALESEKKPVDETIYTTKIKGPIYEPQGECPEISELYDLTKYNQLTELIEKSNAPGPVKAFLRWAAHRHVVFDYQLIAEYYAHAEPEIQELMEDSALVIIDFEKAIEQGFATLSNEIAAGYLEGSKKDKDDE